MAPERDDDDLEHFPMAYPSIVALGHHHKLSEDQFLVFSTLCQKMILRVLRNFSKHKYNNPLKKLKANLERLFTDEPMRGVFIGPAGTGKSRVLNCFFEWVKLWGLEDRVIVGATSAVAASLLKHPKSSTWHKILKVGIDPSKDHMQFFGQDKKFDKVWMFVLDECSMLSCLGMNRIDTRLRVLTKNDRFCGNCDILFAGDFFQLPPVRGFGLFSRVHEHPLAEASVDQVEGSKNYHEKFNFFFILTEIYRSDPELVSVLNNFRTCTPTLEDIEKINLRLVGKNVVVPPKATVIVPYNKQRVSINQEFYWNYVLDFGAARNDIDFSALSYFTILMDVTTNIDEELTHVEKTQLHDTVRNMTEKKHEKRPGKFCMMYGGETMITHNINSEYGIVNGCLCQLAKIIFKNTNLIQYWETTDGHVLPYTYASNVELLVFKHLDKEQRKKVFYKGIPGYFSIKSKKRRVKCDWKTNDAIKASTTQFPCVAAFSITGHKVQGATLKNILVASWKGHGSGMTGWLYVVLSRVRSLTNLFVLEELKKDLTLYRPRPEVKTESDRIDRLAQITRTQILTFLRDSMAEYNE